ncbi:transglutaminase domain-containing protein [Psychroflexus montanilacus]|uniref:transglutaminase domain-containing protein n=1 Tax=Psychroflexus montanilacus TaxID=2873598 RepID=UPI001CCA3F6E|nr:transglutaminase domain-containing protein [Psychroflexus montanilacus]MBZ9651113.1 DUF3857 domain-containing protein [Psychroflexus montanilacus]
MKFFFTSLLVVLFFNLNHSQSKELEDITLEMLWETDSPNDEDGVAEVLYEKGEISFKMTESWEYDFVVTRRVKIYNKDGYDQANVQIPYYVGNKSSDKESVSRIKGYVYYEENGKIEREKLRRKEVFDIDLSDSWEAKKFTLPKIQDGVILEYTYTITSPHVSNLPVWVFQNDIYTRYSEYATKIPNEYLAYSIKSKGYHQFKTLVDQTESPIYVRSAGTQIRTSIKHSQHIINDLPKIKNESFVNNVSNYLPSVGYELSSYKTGEYEAHKSVSKTWDDVVNTLSDTDTYNVELSRSKYFSSDLKTLLRDINLPKEKMIAVFEFVKDRMTWNDKERRYTSDKLNKVYKEKVGNSADINIMLTAMLREAGLDANPVLSSTISHGIPLYPTISGFNYVFTHININGEVFLLDATNEFSIPNVLPKRLLNWRGTVIKPDGFESLNLVPSSSSVKRYQVSAEVNEEGEVDGMCRIISIDQFGLETRNLLYKKSDDDIKLKYGKDFNLNKITEVSTANLNDISKPMVEGFSFSGNGEYVEKIGDKIYLSPMLFLNSKQNPFKDEERIYPIDFTYPRSIEHYISISLPEGYKIDYMPEKAIFNLGDSLLTLTYLIEENNGMISLKVNQNINSILFLPQDYANLKDFYANLINKENEKIVLVKS